MRHLLSAVLGVGACSAGDTTIDIAHDPCDGVTISAPGGTAVEVAGIDDAIALWGARNVSLARVEQNPITEIRFEDASGAFHGVYDDETGVIHINRSLVDPTTLAIVIAHELGHSFGLVHVSNRTSLMNKGNLVTPPTDEDRRAIDALWGTCNHVPN